MNVIKAGYWKKARQQPEKVRQVLDNIQTDGLFSTIDAVRNKLNQPIPMGYCNVGIVNETGRNVSDFQNGDRVLSNGWRLLQQLLKALARRFLWMRFLR